MKKLIKKLEDIMVAITFAEAGEYDAAKREAGAQEESASLASFKTTAIENAKK